MCQKLPLALGTALGLVAQLLSTVGVLMFFESSHETGIRSRGVYAVTRDEWDMVVARFSAILYTVNALFVLVFLAGVFSRLFNKSVGALGKEMVSRVVVVSLTVLIAVSWGAGSIMFLATALCVPSRLLNCGWLVLFLSLQIGYAVLLVLFRVHDILVSTIQHAECSHDEQREEQTSRLTKREYAHLV